HNMDSQATPGAVKLWESSRHSREVSRMSKRWGETPSSPDLPGAEIRAREDARPTRFMEKIEHEKGLSTMDSRTCRIPLSSDSKATAVRTRQRRRNSQSIANKWESRAARRIRTHTAQRGRTRSCRIE